MTDRDEAGKEVIDRISGRFGPDENGETDENDENGENGESGEPSETIVSSELSEPSKPSKPSEPSENDEPAQQSKSAEQSESGESDESNESSGSDLNVKEDWKGRYMYIPPAMHKRFDDEYERLRYECGRDLEWKPKKNQHYYPIVATEGIDAVAEMDPDAFLEAVTSLEYFDREELLTQE